MKIRIECDSPLLQETLEIYLKEFLSKNGQIISDNPKKGDIIIGKDIKKPFTKASLLIQLEKILNLPKKNFEKELDKLIDDFATNLKNLIKEFYGKR